LGAKEERGRKLRVGNPKGRERERSRNQNEKEKKETKEEMTKGKPHSRHLRDGSLGGRKSKKVTTWLKDRESVAGKKNLTNLGGPSRGGAEEEKQLLDEKNRARRQRLGGGRKKKKNANGRKGVRYQTLR